MTLSGSALALVQSFAGEFATQVLTIVQLASKEAMMSIVHASEESRGQDTRMALQDGKIEVPVETLDEVRHRLTSGSVKRVLFDALERAGPNGLNIGSLVDAVQVSETLTEENNAPTVYACILSR